MSPKVVTKPGAMISVRNITARMHIMSQEGIVLRPNVWSAPIPAEVAYYLKARGIVEIGEPASDPEHCKWKDEQGLHLLWMSPFSVGDGYATASEALMHLLRHQGVQIAAKYLWFLDQENLCKETLDLLKKTVSDMYEVGVCVATPGEFGKLPTPYRIGFTMYESTDPLSRHPEWRHECNDVDRLFVPCTYCKDVFGQFTTRPINIVPLAVDDIFVRGENTPVKKPKEDGSFLFVEHGVLTARKSPLEVIDCFQKAFPIDNYPRVRLAFKTRNHILGWDTGQIPNIEDPRVTVVPDGRWSRERMFQFLEEADCEVFPSKGEGFGMPVRESIAMGVPTILSCNTGHADIIDDRYMWPINDVRVESSPLGGEWCIPDMEAVIEAMQWVYKYREEAYKRAQAGAVWFAQKWHGQSVHDKFMAAIDQMGDPFEAVAKKQKASTLWGDFYPVTPPDTMTFLQDHHAKYFEMIRKRFGLGYTFIEVGVGSGATMSKLSTMGYRVFGVDNDSRVIDSCVKSMQGIGVKIPIRQMDASNISRTTIAQLSAEYDSTVLSSQGFFEHLSDAQIRALLMTWLRVARYVVFSVPSVYYPSKDVGDERLMRMEQWMDILASFNVQQWAYYGGDSDHYHLYFMIDGPNEPSRGFTHRLFGRKADGVWRPR